MRKKMIKRTVEFKHEEIASFCQHELENEADIRTERDITKHNGKYRIVYYTENCIDEGKANRIISKYGIY